MSSAPGRRGLWKPIAAAAAAAFVLALLGGLATDIGPWYRSLRMPAWKPSDMLFGPAWTTIYACAATAAVIGWRRGTTPERRRHLVLLFALNAVANVLWSVLFFRLQRPDWALAEVGFLWLSIVVLIVFFSRFSRPSAWLLAPYVLWVSFAAMLNLAVVRLNAPFGG